MGLYDIPERSLDPPTDPPVVCCKCHATFDLGQKLYMDGKEAYCKECFIEWVEDFMETSPDELAERLGFDVEQCQD